MAASFVFDGKGTRLHIFPLYHKTGRGAEDFRQSPEPWPCAKTRIGMEGKRQLTPFDQMCQSRVKKRVILSLFKRHVVAWGERKANSLPPIHHNLPTELKLPLFLTLIEPIGDLVPSKRVHLKRFPPYLYKYALRPHLIL